MTNPPVPATPLDVEACVRLLEEFAKQERDYAETCLSALEDFPDEPDFRRDAEASNRRASLIDALASALPGMGKKADWYDWLADEDHVDWTRRLGNGNFAIETPPFGAKPDIERATLGECIDAARAAQPEETSAPVHNHGTEDGPGLACREHRVNGQLVGACILAASSPSPERPE